MFHPLFFGVAFVLVGVMNFIFDFVLSKKDLEDQRIAIEADADKQEALMRLNAARYRTAVKNVLLTIGGIVSFLASLVTVLQAFGFFKP